MKLFYRFLTISGLFMAAPLPLMIVIGFKSGDWQDLLPGIAVIVGLALLYWWPLGAFLCWHQGRTWRKILFGYLLSMAFFALALTALYPLFGVRFRPFVGYRWLVYLISTPQFYGMVLLLFYLAKWRTAKWIHRLAVVTMIAGFILPFYLMNSAQLAWAKADSGRLAISGARIVDTLHGQIVNGLTVYIQDGRIVDIGDAAVHPDWPDLDVHGQYLAPGLIDVHTHLQSPVVVSAGFQPGYFLKSIMGDYSPQRSAYLSSGITSVRDLGGAARESFQMRDRIARREMLGPRLFTVGRLVTSPHGHPVSTIWPASVARDGAILAKDEQTMLAGLQQNLSYRPDAVKFVHGTIGRAKEELSAALLVRGIRWAKEHQLISVVHAETLVEFEDAIGAGATGVEHAAYLQSVPESLAALVRQNHPFIDPTFGEYKTDLTLSKTAVEGQTRKLERSYESVRALDRAGARLVIGTDAPMVPYGTGFHDELDQFIHAGFLPAEVLLFATINNAAYLGKSSEVGCINSGCRADLILTKNNPLENLGTLRNPIWTMLDGQIVAGKK